MTRNVDGEIKCLKQATPRRTLTHEHSEESVVRSFDNEEPLAVSRSL